MSPWKQQTGGLQAPATSVGKRRGECEEVLRFEDELTVAYKLYNAGRELSAWEEIGVVGAWVAC